jgi:trimeric autotransporter adhesin
MKSLYGVFLFLLCVFSTVNVHAQIITTIAGTTTGGNSGDGGQATTANLWFVGSVAIDGNGNLFICSSNQAPTIHSSVVRKVNPSGIISTFAGKDSLGFSGDGGPATNAKLYGPGSITFDKKGNVYIADLTVNKRVRKVDAAGIITTIAGNGSATISGDGGPATAAGLGIGVGICMDTIGNLYIAAGNKIRKVDTVGIITTFAGTGVSTYSGDGGPATSAQFATQGQIAFDKSGNLYIADGAYRIRKINTSGIITTFAGKNTQGYSGDGGAATNAELDDPTGVFADKCGNIYVADFWNNRVRMINGKGIITTVAGNGFGSGTGSGGFGGDNGPASAAELYHPNAIYLDVNGNIYIADSYNFRVRYIHMDSCINTTEVPTIDKFTAYAEMLRVWPNPNSGSFTFSLSSATNEEVSVVVTNVVGVKVKEFTATTNKETETDLHVPPGMYMISATTAHGIWVKKIMVSP